VICELSAALGYPMSYDHPSEIMDEIARLTPTFAGVSFAKLDDVGSVQWPCNEQHPAGTPIMHRDTFVRGLGKFTVTSYVPTDEVSNRRYPLLLTTGRILSQYNVGAQTRRTANVTWHAKDVLEIHPSDAEERGIGNGDEATLASRKGVTTLHAELTDRVPPGVVYTTFHHPVSGANVVTTEYSDWATNCPEYKVTAVQVTPGRSAAEVELESPEHRIGALARMANQIAREFAHVDHDDAVAAVASHVQRFWTPDMRIELAAASGTDAVRLDQIAAEAMHRVAGDQVVASR
jgi:formate dehydrogenase major subunit